MRTGFKVAVLAGLVSLRAGPAFGQLASFSGAVGYGAVATGARASATPTVYHVTNLNDTGTGSFRDAVSASNRIVVFDVGGYVDIASPISAKSNLTILGQTAPGDGFGVYGAEVSFFGQSNDVVRYMRFMDTTLDPKGQSTSNSSGNCLNLGTSSNMIFDHVSAEFASYNNIDAATAPNLTFQNSLVAAPISSQQFNFHWEGGGSAGNWGGGTFINNVFVDAHNRSILAKGDTQFVNNTIYDYQAAFTANSSGNFLYDVVGNTFKSGPNTSSPNDDYFQISSTQSAYASGNFLNSGTADTVGSATVLNSPYAPTTTSLPQMSASAAYTYNLTHAGDSLKHDTTTFATSLGYEAVDAYMMNEVTSGTGRLWSSQTQTGLTNGGLGTLNSGAKPLDTDNDGIPDAWETAHGMNVNVADSTKLNPVGYTMLEQYADELADATATTRVWSSNGGEWNTASKWSGATTPIPYDIASVQGQGAGTDGLLTVSTTTPIAYQLMIGGNGGAAGEKVQVTAGVLNVEDTIYVGSTNTGTLQIDGGLVQANNVIVGNTVNGTLTTGSVILNGGTLQTNNVVLGGGSPTAWNSGGSITFNGGTLQASGTLLVTAPATIIAGGANVDTNSFNATMSGAISGSGTLNKLGAGVLTLSGSNNFPGVNLKAGEVSVGSDANLGGSGSTINFQGGALQVTGATLTNLDSHNVNWSTFNGGFDIVSSSNTLTINETISGPGSVSVTGGQGVLFLAGNNNYTGGTFLKGGNLEINSLSSVGGATAPLTFAGGSLYIPGTAITSVDSYNINWTTFNGGFNIANAANVFTVGKVISGSGGFLKSGPGVLVLTQSNTFTGSTTVTGGTLRWGTALSLQGSTLNLTTAGVTLDFNGFNPTVGGLSGSQGLDLKDATVSVGQNNASTAYTGVISDSVGGGVFKKVGSGTLTLSASSTFTGIFTISKGKIAASTLANGSVASPIGQSSSAATNLVLDGGTLQYNGSSSITINRLFTLTANGGTLDATDSSGFNLTNTGSVLMSGTGNRTLTLVGSGTGNSLSFGIGDPSSGVTSLTMNGSGRWILNGGGALTYSGTTSVLQGTLLDLGTTNVLPFGPGKGNLSITSGAIFDMNGRSNNINALVGTGDINNRSGTATLTLGNGDAGGSYSGEISNDPLSGTAILNLIKTGAGTQILTAANTYDGTTAINGGVLQFNLATSIGGSGASVTISNNAVAAAGYAMDQSFLGRFTTGSVGAAALALTSANSLNFSSAGLTNVSLGAIGAISFTGTVTPAAATYRLGGTSGTLTLPNAQLTGANGVVVTGPGTVVVSGADNYTGATAINSGTFEIASPGSITSTSINTSTPTTFTIDSGASISALTNLTDAGTTNFKNTTQTIATLNGAGAVNLNPTTLTIKSGGTFSGTIAGSGGLVVAGGSLTLSGAANYVGPTNVSTGATLNLNGAVAGTAAITSSGTVNFSANTATGILVRTISSLSVNNGGTANVLAPTAPGNRAVLVVTNGLSMGGQLDLTANDLIVDGGASSSNVVNALIAGRNAGNGYWNGATGIVSSSAAADSRFLTTLGYMPGGTVFDGVSTSSADMLVKYTYNGDANFDGAVTFADYDLLRTGFANHLTGWSNGDFNYDGVVDGTDFSLFDNTFLALNGFAVPEPAELSLIICGVAGLLGRKRRARGR